MRIIMEEISKDELLNEISEIIQKELAPYQKFIKCTHECIISRKSASEILEVSPRTLNNYQSRRLINPIFRNGSTKAEYKMSEILALKAEMNLKKGHAKSYLL